jgi:uroporphyrin-3 C-methyltransferase
MEQPAEQPAQTPAPTPAPRKAASLWRIAAAVLAVAVLAASVAAWLDARNRIGATQEELARRLRDIETDAREARASARQAQESMREALGRLGAVEGKLADAQSQQVALEALYQELSRNRDEWQLAEIEQVLAIAAQQLQLSGNVRAALLALQLAESRLARADRPQFLPVRRALGRDIERLKALPAADVAGTARRIDELLAGVDALPLAFEARAQAEPREAPRDAPQGALARFGAGLWQELKQLVVVRRADAPEPPLLAPTQAYFLRENLRLRLLNARLALLARNQEAWQGDLRAAQAWLQRYFDARARPTQAALAQVKQLLAAPVGLEPPSIAESLEAVRSFKARRERSSG